MKFEEIFGNAEFAAGEEQYSTLEMRGIFEAPEAGTETELVICGLGYFNLKVNGQRVSRDLFMPAYSHYHDYKGCVCSERFSEQLGFRIYVMKYDISHLVRKGENVLAVELGRGWYSHPDFCHEFNYGQPRLCYRVCCGGQEFVSSPAIRWRDGCVCQDNFYTGETQDYTKHNYCDGWENPGYDDSSWEAARTVETPESNYFIQDCPPDRVIRSICPRVIGETDTHRVYDLGENITGWPIVRCAAPGEQVSLRLSERAIDGHLDERWTHGQHYDFTADGADREYHPRFCYQTFSCVELSKNAELVRCDVIHTDVPVTAEFSCDNEVLNWFHEAFLRTQLDNIHNSIPSDCPQREKRGYTGDGQLVCETAMLLLDGRRMYQKWMEDISDCQDRVSGHVQYTAPYVRSGGGPGGWGCAIVEVPYQYYKIYGCREPLEKYFPQMLHYFDYLEAHSQEDLLVSDQPGQWCLGEWCTPNFRHNYGGKPVVPAPLVNTYFYIRTLRRMEEICRVLGQEQLIFGLAETRRKKEAALVRAYFDPATGDFAENQNDCNVFAVDLGLGDSRTLANLTAELTKRGTFNSGIFGTELLIGTLFRKGFGDLAVQLLTTEKVPSFGYMMRNGATTLWEEWFGPRSMCHPMFGALTKYFYYYLLGIRQREDSAAFREIDIDPVLTEKIRYVRGSIRTDLGDIRVTVDRRRTHTLKVEIPAGIRARYRGELLRPGITSFGLEDSPRLNGAREKVRDFETYI